MWKVFPLLFILLWARSESPAKTKDMSLKWSELEPVIKGKTVAVLLPDLVRVEGTVTSVESDSMVIEVKRSSNATLHPIGRETVPRASISELQMASRSHRYRVLGAAAGAGVGFFVPIMSSLVNSGGGTGFTLEYASDASWIAVPVGAGVGYLLGHLKDKGTTYIAVSDSEADVSSASGGAKRSRQRLGLSEQSFYRLRKPTGFWARPDIRGTNWLQP